MKLATFCSPEGAVGFGPVLDDDVVVDLAEVAGRDPSVVERVRDAHAYSSSLSESHEIVEMLLRSSRMADARRFRLSEVSLLAPLPRPAAILDCGLSPKHLMQAGSVAAKYNSPAQVEATSAMVTGLTGGPEPIRYYKGNPNNIIGDRGTLGWPDFTAYLDIEPELAMVTGHVPCGATRDQVAASIAGYTIFNDGSARDVQAVEMFFTGPASCKDFDSSNGLGPWLVTPDEIDDPLDLAVTVLVGDREPWTGTTSDYSMAPAEAVYQLARRQTLVAGTVIGMGTVPNTCGLDRDEWIVPGDEVRITFEGIGSLRQHIGHPRSVAVTDWPARPDLTRPVGAARQRP
ncbi:MAG: fumarylacetoacetate hydrolase family protein [Acidimicrobiales bacterium]